MSTDDIPLLTESVEENADAEQKPEERHVSEADLEWLRSRLTKSGLVLIERLLARMLKDLESTLVDRLRQRAQYELPILIDDILKEQTTNSPDDADGET